MNKILLVILLLFPTIVFSQKECEVTYISNEGFLIEIDGIKVMVDALFDEIKENWCDSPSDSITDLMKNSKPPFDNIDIIAITHKHVDHFNESIVVQHMLSNRNGIVICPNQVNAILAENPNYQKIKDRIISITPEPMSDSNIVVSNVSIKVLRLEHSGSMKKDPESGEMVNRHHEVENVGYLFSINGDKIFHCGDTNPLNEKEYNTFELYKEEIDIAFVERLFFTFYREKDLEMISKFLNPDNIIMHIRPEDKGAYFDYAYQKDGVYVFINKMESINIEVQ
jgi:L-ascorbate metabolism protein UlaG (beta-lactamase superfamily)